MHEELRAAILAYTANPAYRAVKPAVIAERLGLVGDAAAEVKKTIKKMVRAEELEFGPNHLVVPIDPDHPSRANLMPKQKEESPRTSNKKHVVGTFRRVASGDGFVRPEGTPASAGKDLDLYVHARNASDAANGDTVRIVLSGRSGPRGKPEGRVTDVVERAASEFVGTYLESAGMGLVRVDGKLFGDPIYVGDPGAKGAAEGDKVLIEMVRFPSHVRDGEGVITRILGGKGEPGVDTQAIKIEFNLPGDFPEEALEEARRQAELFDEETIPDGRRDLREEVILTIDPKTARDFDDAISLKRIENDHWELGVHIADVSHFVQPKTPLDREAYDRATSVYLPDEVIPMLPEVISNNLASLQPDKTRYAMTALIEFTPDGTPIGAEVFKSAIRSRRRFTYEEVDAWLANREHVEPTKKVHREDPPETTPEVEQLLGDMFQLAMALRGRRFERGALELHMPEVRVDLDNEGRVCGAHVEENTESHQIIEEFMLAANEAVARLLADAGLIFLRRLHGNPDPRKGRALTEFVRSLGLPANNLQDRFELQELLDRVKGDPREHAVNFATLRSMQKAVYGPDDEGHYALASDCYCHFTSPIRRYPDLTIHRLVEALTQHTEHDGPKPMQEMATYLQWGDHCSEREQRAASAERELTKVKLLHFLEERVGMELEGVITGVERFGLFVMGRGLPAEGFIHISALGDDHFKYDKASHSISGYRSGNTFRLGDLVRVSVASVDVDARELDFRFLGRLRPFKRTGDDTKPGKKRRPSRGKNTLRKQRQAAAEGNDPPRKGKGDKKGSGKGKKNGPAKGGSKMSRGKTDKTGKHRKGKRS